MKALLVTMALALSLAGARCNPSSVPPTNEVADASDAPVDAGGITYSDTPVGKACANLARVGCAAGVSTVCEKVLRHAVDSPIATVLLDCLIGAQSKPSAQACGFVACK